MARIEGREVQDKLCQVFGIKPEELTPAQVFALVKIIKHCRLRCKNNAALHNWLKKGFPDLSITTVKMASKFNPNETYDALKVFNPKAAGQVAAVDDDEGKD